MNWLDTMRKVDVDAQRYATKAREMSSGFDEMIRYEGLVSYLRALRKGQEPSGALQTALTEARSDDTIWYAHRQVLEAAASAAALGSSDQPAHQGTVLP